MVNQVRLIARLVIESVHKEMLFSGADTIDALISYRPQSSKLQDPKTELTLRAVQRLTGGPSSPSFYASYYERMITRRGIQA